MCLLDVRRVCCACRNVGLCVRVPDCAYLRFPQKDTAIQPFNVDSMARVRRHRLFHSTHSPRELSEADTLRV